MMARVDLKIRRNDFGRAESRRFFGASLRGVALVVFAAVATIGQQAAAPGPAKKQAGGGRGAKPRADVARFGARVDAALAEAHAAKALWGVLVTDRDTGEILYELHADRFFTPASNAKIITTSLALAMLGPTYQFRTTWETSGKLGEDGRCWGIWFLWGAAIRTFRAGNFLMLEKWSTTGRRKKFWCRWPMTRSPRD